jgi:hypothetical protein
MEPPVASARMTSFKAKREVLISAPSSLVARLELDVSAPRSLPARSIKFNRPTRKAWVGQDHSEEGAFIIRGHP